MTSGDPTLTTLTDKLRRLGLVVTADALNDLVARATRARWSPTQLLEHVAQAELDDRARRRLERQLRAARLGRSGTVVVLDNVVRGGEVADPDTADAKVQGARRGILMLGSDPRFDATALQTLDRKGWDGVALAIVVDPTPGGRGH